jgi:hypothetical protein
MLTPEYLAACAAQAEEMYARLNEQITADICRRIIKTGEITDTAQWQLKQLQESGMLMNDILTDVANATPYSESELMKMFRDAGVASVRFDAAPLIAAGMNVDTGLSKPMMNVLEANLRRTNGDLSNLAMTTASNGQQEFINAMNEAIMKVQSGAFDYQTAIRQCVNDCARIGAKVSYDSGSQLNLEAAARMNILTAVNQTAAKITEMNAERLGAEYYETSAHAGARLEHQEWQGQVFKIEGADADYPNFYDATGYGEVTGLCGVNCRHSFFPFWPGISKPAYDAETLDRYANHSVEYNGVEYSDYEASQIQRRIERSIRESKRVVEGYKAAIEEATDEATAKSLKQGLTDARKQLQARRSKLTDFCNQTDRKKESIRHKASVFVPAKPKMKISFPDDITSVKGVTVDVKATLDKAMKKLESEYNIKLSQIVVEKCDKGDVFVTGYVSGEGRMAMVVNQDADFDKIIARMEKQYERGYFAGRTLEDYVAHEAFHVMLYQDCLTDAAFEAKFAEVESWAPVLKGVSKYADRSTGKVANEALAEAFVRMRNGEQVNPIAEALVKKYIGGYAK